MYCLQLSFLRIPACTCLRARGLPCPRAAAGGDITGSFPAGQAAAGQTDLETPLTLWLLVPLWVVSAQGFLRVRESDRPGTGPHLKTPHQSLSSGPQG